VTAGWPRAIPDEAAWAGYDEDLDVQYAHHLLAGKSIDEVKYQFRDTFSIERASELLYAPRPVFQYYVFAFVAIFGSPAESVGESDCASVFLHFLCDREKRDPGSVADIWDELRGTVDHVANNQAFYDANLDIYGDFRDLAAELTALCEPRDTPR
jgi:hypothetical protein